MRKPKALLDANPRAQVPTLVAGDLVLYDSTVILEWLEERQPEPPLLPRGADARAGAAARGRGRLAHERRHRPAARADLAARRPGAARRRRLRRRRGRDPRRLRPPRSPALRRPPLAGRPGLQRGRPLDELPRGLPPRHRARRTGARRASGAVEFRSGAGNPNAAALPCDTVGLDRYVDTKDRSEWYCSAANTWTPTAGAAGQFDVVVDLTNGVRYERTRAVVVAERARALPPDLDPARARGSASRLRAEQRTGALRLVASGDGRDGSIRIRQDVALYAALLGAGDAVAHALPPGRHAWLQVGLGSCELNGIALAAGAGGAVSGETALRIRGSGDAELLPFDLA